MCFNKALLYVTHNYGPLIIISDISDINIICTNLEQALIIETGLKHGAAFFLLN